MNTVIIKLTGGLVTYVCTSSAMKVLVLDTDMSEVADVWPPREFKTILGTQTFKAHVQDDVDFVDSDYCEYIINANEKQNDEESI